jgi:hypothetical protein
VVPPHVSCIMVVHCSLPKKRPAPLGLGEHAVDASASVVSASCIDPAPLDDPVWDSAPPGDPAFPEWAPDDELLAPSPEDEPAEDPPYEPPSVPMLEALPPHDALAMASRPMTPAARGQIMPSVWPRRRHPSPLTSNGQSTLRRHA